MQRDAQRTLYEQYASKLYRICKRYLKKEEDAEEALADAFFSILTKIESLNAVCAFDAWARKITVNHCLARLKKTNNFNIPLDDLSHESQPFADEATDLEEEDLLNLLDQIPEGCKTVFNLFVIEGFSHKEIATMLHISEGTSKSQLNASKSKLKELVNNVYYLKAK
jgi:RNA polymerase sigma-70 factor (ECF subfamily)